MKTVNQSSLDQKRYALEATLTTKVREWLEVQSDIVFYKASDRYTKGISDFVICVGGMFVGAELKADDGEPTPQQNLFIKNIRRIGGIAGVCYTLGEVKDLVEQARRRVG